MGQDIWQIEWSNLVAWAPIIAKFWTHLNSSILPQLGQTNSSSIFPWNIDDDGVFACEHPKSCKEIMLLWSFWLSTPVTQENIYLAPILGDKDKMFLNGGMRALPKVLEFYMGVAMWPTKPPRWQMAHHSRALIQHGGIFAWVGLSWCNVFPIRQWPFEDWSPMGGNSHKTFGYGSKG